MHKINVKDGVIFKEINSFLLNIMITSSAVMDLFGMSPTVTSANDGTHMPTSRHYDNMALDLRTHDLPSQEIKDRFLQEMKSRLGADYIVIFEGLGTPNEHLHCQYGTNRPGGLPGQEEGN